ncbi:MAG: hypothetical protein EOO77_21060, partial [Oxalobacteraceae bacterium]
LPDAPLRMDAISNFDAHILYKVKDFRNPKFPISNVDLTFDLKDKLMVLSPFTLDIAGQCLDRRPANKPWSSGLVREPSITLVCIMESVPCLGGGDIGDPAPERCFQRYQPIECKGAREGRSAEQSAPH